MKHLICVSLLLISALVHQPVIAQESSSLKMQSEILNDEVTIEWLSEHEINVRYFLLERSSDGETYTNIAIVPAKNRYPVPAHYKFCDHETQLYPGTSVYYRLKKVDMNGNVVISKLAVEKDGEGLISSR